MTNRVGDLCDISTGPNPLFPPSETATTSEADDRPEREEEEEPISEAEPSDDDDDVEEIEEPVPLQVESVAHRLVNIKVAFNIAIFALSTGAYKRINTKEPSRRLVPQTDRFFH